MLSRSVLLPALFGLLLVIVCCPRYAVADNVGYAWHYGDTVLIPLRDVCDWAGITLSYDDTTKQITLQQAGVTALLTLDERKATVAGKEVKLPCAPMLIKWNFCPLTGVLDAYGVDGKWDKEAFHVRFTRQGTEETLDIPVIGTVLSETADLDGDGHDELIYMTGNNEVDPRSNAFWVNKDSHEIWRNTGDYLANYQSIRMIHRAGVTHPELAACFTTGEDKKEYTFYQWNKKAFKEVFLPRALSASGVTLAPLSLFTLQTGWSLGRNLERGTATLSSPDHKLTFTPFSRNADLDGNPFQLSSPPLDCGGTVYAPIRDLVKAVGGTVDLENHILTIQPEGTENVLMCRVLGQVDTLDADFDGDGLKERAYGVFPGDTLGQQCADNGASSFWRACIVKGQTILWKDTLELPNGNVTSFVLKAMDVTGDGIPDLLLSGNTYATTNGGEYLVAGMQEAHIATELTVHYGIGSRGLYLQRTKAGACELIHVFCRIGDDEDDEAPHRYFAQHYLFKSGKFNSAEQKVTKYEYLEKSPNKELQVSGEPVIRPYQE